MGIEFSFNKKILYIFIFPIIYQFEIFVTRLYMNNDRDKNYVLFNMFKIFLSYLLSLVFIIIREFRTKNGSNKNNHTNLNEIKDLETEGREHDSNPIDIELKKKKCKEIRNNILFICLLSLLDLIAYFVNYFDDNINFKFFLNSLGILCEIISFGLLSLLILKQRLYIHHYVSSGIIFICLIILFFVYYIELVRRDVNFNYWVFLYYPIYTLLYSSYNVSGKKYMDKYFNSPYFMIFMIGLINSIILFVYDVIAFFVKPEYSGIIIGILENLNSFKNVMLFLLDLIIKCLYTVGIWLTIYYFTPCHFIISDFISEMIKFYIRAILITRNVKDDDDGRKYYLNSVIIPAFTIIYLINFFCSLIFNEIIIIKYCNLHFFTQIYIKARERIDSSLTMTNNNLDEESIISSEYSGE